MSWDWSPLRTPRPPPIKRFTVEDQRKDIAECETMADLRIIAGRLAEQCDWFEDKLLENVRTIHVCCRQAPHA